MTKAMQRIANPEYLPEWARRRSVLSSNDMAEIFGIDTATVRWRVANGRLPQPDRLKVNGVERCFWSCADVREFLRTQHRAREAV